MTTTKHIFATIRFALLTTGFFISLSACITLAGPPASPLDGLSGRDRERVMQILQQVSKKADMPTQEAHAEFWAIWGRKQNWSDKDIEDLKDKLVGVSLIYMKYFWEDALAALESGKPEKNPTRARYEERLLELGVLTQEKVKENEENIMKIAFREPLVSEGRGYVVTKQGIEYVLSSLNAAAERVSRLFSKEYKQ